MDEPVLDRLRRLPAVAALLDQVCDFRALDEPQPGWFALASGEPLRVVGRDGSGGRFCLHEPAGDEPALLYVSSEGEAGVIAGSLAAGLAVMVALPYWRDCLKFSRGGQLDAMRRAREESEARLRAKRPNLDEVRDILFRGLGLPAPGAPLEALHAAVSGSATRQVVAPSDRNPFASLFNTFGGPAQS